MDNHGSDGDFDYVVNCKKQNSVKHQLLGMGIALLVLGTVTLGCGIAVVVVVQGWYPNDFTAAGSGIWGSIYPLITGILLVILSKFLKRCLIIWTLLHAALSALFLFAIVFFSTAGGISQNLNSNPPPTPAYTTTTTYYHQWDDYNWDWRNWLYTIHHSVPAMALNIVLLATSLPMLIICIYTCVMLGRMWHSKANNISFWDMWPDCCYKCQCFQCVAQPIVYYSGIPQSVPSTV